MTARVRAAWSVVRDRWLLRLWLPLLAIGAASVADYADARWMAKEGLDVLAGGGIVHPDRWSWAPVSNDFVPTSPGWDVVLGVAWRLGGETGLFLLTAGALFLAFAVAAWLAHRLGAGHSPTIAAIIVSVIGIGGLYNARASIAAVALLLLEFGLMQGRRSVAAIGAIGFACGYIGVWIHGSWTAFALVAGVGNVWLILTGPATTHRRRTALSVAGFLAPLVGAALGPLGLGAWSNAARVAEQCRGLIREWSTPWALGWDVTAQWIVLMGITVALLRFSLRREASPNRSLLQLLALLGLGGVAAGAIAARFMLIGAFVALPAFAAWIANGITWEPMARRLGDRGREPYWRTIIALLLVVAAPVDVVAFAVRESRPDQVIMALPRDCHLFSNDESAKAISLYRPDVRTWFDGRQDYWGRARMGAMHRWMSVQVPGRILPDGATCVILERDPAPKLASALDASPSWHRIAESDEHIVWAASAR